MAEMANLTLNQCDNCGFAEFSTYGLMALGARIHLNATGEELTVCKSCVDHLMSRMNMYELTGDAKTPVKMREVWPPNREQNEHPDGYTG
jgi:ribosome-binding protein aMBF1 (putative translation factor)